MGRIKLLNTAMMPSADGVYRSKALSFQEFGGIVRHAFYSGQLESYIGYPETAAMLEDALEIPVLVNRSETVITDGDFLMIAKLKYRVGDPKMKGNLTPTLSDFEFRSVEFKEV